MTAHSPLRLHWLDPRKPREPFPDVELALPDPNGLLAIGGDLTVSRMLQAYRKGIFPWFNPDEPILWWSPNPRAVFALPDIHVSRRMQRVLRRDDYALTLDQAFSQVTANCATTRPDGTWLGGAMQAAYLELHRRGFAHSVEVWRDGTLIGGLYGVALGRIFFGESMFSLADHGSKIALIWLGRQLHAWGFEVLDCQVGSGHLYRMGARDMPRRDFSARLRDLVHLRPSGSWQFDIDVPGVPAHLPRAGALLR